MDVWILSTFWLLWITLLLWTILWGHMFSFLLDTYLGVEFLGHMETPCITFLWNYETVSQSTCTIPTGMHEDFNFWKLCPFLSGLFIFSLLSYSSLHIMDTNPVSDTWFVNIFSHSVGCLFIYLVVSSAQNFLNFDKDQYIWGFFLLFLVLWYHV